MIMRDVNSGWLIRYTHANVASFFFIFVYAHIGRNLYYGSYKSPRVLPYAVGVIILVLMIATAFLGWIYGPKCYILIIKSHITLFLNSIIFFKTLSSKSLIINYFYLRLKKFFFKFKLSVAPTPLVLGGVGAWIIIDNFSFDYLLNTVIIFFCRLTAKPCTYKKYYLNKSFVQYQASEYLNSSAYSTSQFSLYLKSAKSTQLLRSRCVDNSLIKNLRKLVLNNKEIWGKTYKLINKLFLACGRSLVLSSKNNINIRYFPRYYSSKINAKFGNVFIRNYSSSNNNSCAGLAGPGPNPVKVWHNLNLSTRYSSEVKEFLKECKLNPIFVFEDLHLEETKKKIKSKTEGLSGVYLILNKTTSDFYVGSASTNKFYARFVNHLYYFIGSKILKLAVRKYGLSNFSFIILELFPEIDNKENNKKLLDLEDFYLKSLLPNYNILTEAGNSFGYKHTEITRIKMKKNYSQERRDKIGNLNLNKKLSPEIIEKIRSSALSRTKPIYSKEALNNMKKRSKAVIIYNLDKTVYGEFPSIVEAAKKLKCGEKTIRRALNGETKFLKRKWIVAYSCTEF